MARAHDREVAPVERRDLRLVDFDRLSSVLAFESHWLAASGTLD